MKEKINKELSITIIIDTSGSMVENGKDILLHRVYRLLLSKMFSLKDFDIDLSLITFGDDVNIEFEYASIGNIPNVNYKIGGQSDFSKVVEMLSKDNYFNDTDHMVIVITDGDLLDSKWKNEWKKMIEQHDLNIFVVKIGQGKSSVFLKNLVNGNIEHIISTENVVNIPFIYEPSISVQVQRYDNIQYDVIVENDVIMDEF